MKKKLYILILILISVNIVAIYAEQINIIPFPNNLIKAKGFFVLSEQSHIAFLGKEAKEAAYFFRQKLRNATHHKLKNTNCKIRHYSNNLISFQIDKTIKGKENYCLKVFPNKIIAKASTPTGLFYAAQSLLQLCPPTIEQKNYLKHFYWKIPCVTINDGPRFSYRGILLDPARHFIPIEELKKEIRILSSYKLNYLHLHLTDDQGWRIEIKRYPKLITIGSKRIEGDGTIYQGYYTQKQLKELVAYALKYHINIIPELEIPGHELAAIASYPYLSCTGKEITPRNIWGVEEVVMSPAKESTFTFLKNVIDEMVKIFPCKYFHIGGDECPKVEWKKSLNCNILLKKLGYTRIEQLQDYVIERIAKYLAKKGKKLIGWDEILEGGNLEPSSIVMSWRGEEGGILAAQKGHYAIMAPSTNGLYFDHYQDSHMTAPTAIGGYDPIWKVYKYNPIPKILQKENKQHYILGVEGCTWGEYLYTSNILEYRLYPRVLALSETGWTLQKNKNFQDFCERLDSDGLLRLKYQNIHFHTIVPQIKGISSNKLTFTDSMRLNLYTIRPIKIIYTENGKDPTSSSSVYTHPILITKNTTVKTATIYPNGIIGDIRTIRIKKCPIQNAVSIREGILLPGLEAKIYEGNYLKVNNLYSKRTNHKMPEIITLRELSSLNKLKDFSKDLRNITNYSVCATGLIKISHTNIYEFSTNNTKVYIDGKLVIDNSYLIAPKDSRENIQLNLEKGYHKLKVIFLGGIFGGWPSYWNDTNIKFRSSKEPWRNIKPDMLYHISSESMILNNLPQLKNQFK